MVKWKLEKENLEKLIKDGISYEEIGRKNINVVDQNIDLMNIITQDMIKIDIHDQIMMNIDVIADLLSKEFKIE